MVKDEIYNLTIGKNIFQLLDWIEENNYSSYDHYDLLSTKIGVFFKRLHSFNSYIALPFVLILFIFDIYFPMIRKLVAKKVRSNEAIPNIVNGYFRLYKLTGNPDYLDKGLELINWLIENKSQTKYGIGWGLHFDWQGRVFIPKGTPCVTLTAYATEALISAYRLTKNIHYLDYALKTSRFVVMDLNKKEQGNKIAVSYTPLDNNYVINANSYAARILLEVLPYNQDRSVIKLIDGILEYILDQQNEDGSWFYFDKLDVPKEKNFIDNFHTCFVLENLFIIWKWNKNERLKKSILKGFEFYKNNFINSDFSVRYYYYYPKFNGIKVDIRGCAETIYCLALLGEMIPEAFDLAVRVADWTMNNMRHKNGFYYFRIYNTHRSKIPYIRWGQAPMFYALTYLYWKMNNGPKK